MQRSDAFGARRSWKAGEVFLYSLNPETVVLPLCRGADNSGIGSDLVVKDWLKSKNKDFIGVGS